MSESAPTGDLRDRLAEALLAETYPYGYGDARGDVLDVADAVLPVVEAALVAAVAEEQQRADDRRTELLEERDEALAAVERVRDLCARMRSHPYTRKAADRIEAALDKPGAAPNTPTSDGTLTSWARW
ncbi:hypothetical protein ACH35V_40785 [Actinomadura sp. 1N219]|uniref:hypothetical protein n=1 Tax=Actinomadura sp. 1N219 TaxID=3375152 RepID=UPI0037B4B757